MSDKFEKKINEAFNHATPDILDEILLDIKREVKMENRGKEFANNESREVKKMEKSKLFKRLTVVACALIIFIGGGIGVSKAQKDKRVENIVSLDVNPSIELKTNYKERVIDATYLNEDGRKVLDGMELRGSDLNVAVNAIIGSMVKNGYISELKNSILLTVDGQDKAKSIELQNKLSKEIDKLLNATFSSASVLSQALDSKEVQQKLDKLAEEYGISKGKAKLISEIVKADKRYEFKDLVPLTIHELNLIGSANSNRLNKVSSRGKVTDKGYIGIKKAKSIALKHSKVPGSLIRGFDYEMDYEFGKMVYEMSFHFKGMEYEYDIDAKTGKILKHKKEHDDDYYEAKRTPRVKKNYDDDRYDDDRYDDDRYDDDRYDRDDDDDDDFDDYDDDDRYDDDRYDDK